MQLMNYGQSTFSYQCDLLSVGLLAQLVERCTGITEVKGSNPVLPCWPDFFFSGFLFANVTATQVNCDDLLSFACILMVFSVTPFKIGQNKNQHHSTDKVQNLGNERR